MDSDLLSKILLAPYGKKSHLSIKTVSERPIIGKESMRGQFIQREDMAENRRQSRKFTNDYFLVYETKSNQLIGRVLDLTPDGAMLIGDRLVPVPVKYSCKMVMPRMVGRHRFLYFEVESRWCQKNPRLGWHETGYQITRIDKEFQEVINEMIGEWIVRVGTQELTVNVESA